MRALLPFLAVLALSGQDVAIRAERLCTLEGPAIADGVVLIQKGRITAVGSAASVTLPPGILVRRAAVAVPGLVDAHATVGFSGVLNQPQDQEQVERSAPVQPELRAVDAYNPKDPLLAWLRNRGVTTVHTGHGPLALVSGQTLVAHTAGDTVDLATILPQAMVAATLGDGARALDGKSPGSRAKEMALLRGEFVAAQEYMRKRAAGGEKEPARDLRKDLLVQVLKGEVPLLVTAQRARDILTALRLREEFGFRLVLDGAAEAPQVLREIKAAGVPVLLHPTMVRPFGETEEASLETAARLKEAGIPFALQSGYEAYVPKTRVVLWEAAMAAANGLGPDAALAAVTRDAAAILGLGDRLGSLKVGKDGDVALYDGDPFEYTTHCTGTIIGGKVVSEGEAAENGK